jgi:hypothetical protein
MIICFIIYIFKRKKKRRTPKEDAEFWFERGVDQEGFAKKFISREKGLYNEFSRDFTRDRSKVCPGPRERVPLLSYLACNHSTVFLVNFACDGDVSISDGRLSGFCTWTSYLCT